MARACGASPLGWRRSATLPEVVRRTARGSRWHNIMVAASPRTAAHGTQIEQPRAVFTHPGTWSTPWYHPFSPTGWRGLLAAAATPQFGPRHPVLRPVVLESSSRCHFLPTPNRGRRGGPNLSVRRDGRERVGACGRSCHGLPRGSGCAAHPERAAGDYPQGKAW